MPRIADTINKADLPSSRSKAIALGFPHYFTGKPCKYGHVDMRRISGTCFECDREKAAAKRDQIKNDPEKLEQRRAKQLAYAMQRLVDPKVRAQVRGRENELYHTNPKRKAAKKAADAIRHSKLKVRDRMRKLRIEREARLKKTDPVKFARVQQARAVALRQATPPWVRINHADELAAIYTQAQRLTRQTGVNHDVDHIVPLQNPFVCGLHTPWNLQILTARQNRAKGNVFDAKLVVEA